MLPTFRSAIAISLCSVFFFLPSELGCFSAEAVQTKPAKPPKPKPPKPAKPKPKPKPRTTSTSVKRTTTTPAAVRKTTVSAIQAQHFSGTSPKSQSWYRHHHHHRWVYEVRFRSRQWHHRAFGSYYAALAYMQHLRWHHYQRFLSRPTGTLWVVNYRSWHSHRFGMYAYLPVARRVEVGLWQNGFPAWVVWHRRYYW
jgi:hypothetical protein